MYGNLPGGGIPPASVAAGGMLASTGFPAAGAILAACALLIGGVLLLRTRFILERSEQS